MTEIIRPRRSLLFVPGANARALEKSSSLPADGLIYDLEDSAAPEQKETARETLRLHLEKRDFAGERIVRINTLDTPWGREDLSMVRAAGADAILLPKVESVEMLRQVVGALDGTDRPESLRLWAMIETPLGILDVAAIAGSAPSTRLEALIVGPNDIALSTGIEPGPERVELVPWMMSIVLAAKTYGLTVLDGVYADFKNMAGFEAECAAGRRMGFTGKTLIHPSQVDAANAAFSPSEADIAFAETVVAAFARSENLGRGVLNINGRMVERLHLKQAERLLAMRDALARRNSQ